MKQLKSDLYIIIKEQETTIEEQADIICKLSAQLALLTAGECEEKSGAEAIKNADNI